MHLVSSRLLSDVSTACLESTCGKLSWLDTTKSTEWILYTGLYKIPQLRVQSTNHTMKFKELSVDLQHWIVSRRKSGEAYGNVSAALEIPVSTAASIIHKWKKFETPGLFVELDTQPVGVEGPLSEWSSVLSHLPAWAPALPCGERRTF